MGFRSRGKQGNAASPGPLFPREGRCQFSVVSPQLRPAALRWRWRGSALVLSFSGSSGSIMIRRPVSCWRRESQLRRESNVRGPFSRVGSFREGRGGMRLRRVSLSGTLYAPCGTGHTVSVVSVVGHRLTVLGSQWSAPGGRRVSGPGVAQRGQDGLATQGRDALATAAGLHRSSRGQ